MGDWLCLVLYRVLLLVFQALYWAPVIAMLQV